jgi:ribonuclease I
MAGLVAMLVQAASAQPSHPVSAPGGWIAEWVWSPEYCNDDLASKAPQCTGEHYFEIGALRPVSAAGEILDEDCPDAESLDREATDKLMWVVPNQRTLQRMWSEQGRCSGLDRDEYFRQVERARRRVIVPAQYRSIVETRNGRLDTVRKDFIDANPGLDESGIKVRCSGSRWLRSVQVCFAPDFSFRACSAEAAPTCASELRIREIRPSRVGRKP